MKWIIGFILLYMYLNKGKTMINSQTGAVGPITNTDESVRGRF